MANGAQLVRVFLSGGKPSGVSLYVLSWHPTIGPRLWSQHAALETDCTAERHI